MPSDGNGGFLKFITRSFGVFAGCVALVTGIWLASDVVFGDTTAFIVGVWQSLSGVLTIGIEASFCFPAMSQFFDRRPSWVKALLYCSISFPLIFEMFSYVRALIGSGLILMVGALYGYISIGKRSILNGLHQNSSLVDNAAPMGGTTYFTL